MRLLSLTFISLLLPSLLLSCNFSHVKHASMTLGSSKASPSIPCYDSYSGYLSLQITPNSSSSYLQRALQHDPLDLPRFVKFVWGCPTCIEEMSCKRFSSRIITFVSWQIVLWSTRISLQSFRWIIIMPLPMFKPLPSIVFQTLPQ